ncbi:MAG: hypothetical protein KGZ74_16530 [Chitinophagaceae bacterium]|nr:hypothetical protein [Chitinophagaceae bacterium]
MKKYLYQFIILLSILSFYTITFMATSVPEPDPCPGFPYTRDSTVRKDLIQLPGYLYHTYTGFECRVFVAGFKDSTGINYLSLSDSCCISLKKAGMPIDTVKILKIGTAPANRVDTISISICR